MATNPYDQFVTPAASTGNPYDQFVEPAKTVANAAPQTEFDKALDELFKIPKVGPRLAAVLGAAKGLGSTALNVQSLVGKGASAVGLEQIGQSLQEDAAKGQTALSGQIAPYKQQFPTAVGAGQFVGEVIPTLPIGGLLGKAASYVPGAPAAVVNALRTGGFDTGVVSNALARTAAGLAPLTALQKVGNLGVKAATGAAVGGATGLAIDPDSASIAAGIGALLPTAGAAAVKLGAGFAGWLGDALTGKLGEVGAGKVMRGLAGQDLTAIQAALANAAPNLTAGQAVAEAGIHSAPFQAGAALAAGQNPASFFTKKAAADTAEHLASLRGVTPDLTAATNARTVATQPSYRQAEQAVVQMDPAMETLFNRMPKGTLEKAADIARMENRPFVMGQTTPAQQVPSAILGPTGQPVMQTIPAQTAEITGESLHYIKRALSDIANAPPAVTGAGRDTQAAARDVLSAFIKKFEKEVPVYGTARTTFARESVPIDQSKVLTEMASVLEKPGGGERVTPFLNALGRGETAMLKRSTGFPRYEQGDLSQLLTPKQMGVVEDIASQLKRDITMGNQASSGGASLSRILEDNAMRFNFPPSLSTKIAIARKGLEAFEGSVKKSTLDALSEGMKSGQSAASLLATFPAAERNKVLDVLRTSSLWNPAVAPIATNALTPKSRNSNALAPAR